MSKPQELERLSGPELDEKARTLRHELFGLRVQHGQRQLAKPATLRNTRRELARVLTIARAKTAPDGAKPKEKAS